MAQRGLVRYATLAANSHNSQPWRFRLSDRSISVAPDFGRRLASVDPDNHHLFASLGCATENLVQAAAAFGLRATASFDAAAGGMNVDLEKSPRARSPLFEAIPRRQSTRSVFDGRAVPAEHLRLLETVGNADGVQLQLFTERKQLEDILAYLVAGNSAEMDDADYNAELKAWLRFNYAEVLEADDGLFSKCSDNPTLPSWLGRLIFSLVVTKDGENKKCEAHSGVPPALQSSSPTRTNRPLGALRGDAASGRPPGDGARHSALLHQPACRSSHRERPICQLPGRWRPPPRPGDGIRLWFRTA